VPHMRKSASVEITEGDAPARKD